MTNSQEIWAGSSLHSYQIFAFLLSTLTQSWGSLKTGEKQSHRAGKEHGESQSSSLERQQMSSTEQEAKDAPRNRKVQLHMV